MAASYARHFTLAAGVAQTFTLPSSDYVGVEIMNRSGGDEIYVSFDGTAAPATPTALGNDLDVIPAATGAALQLRRDSGTAITVKLISAAGTTASIRGIR
jgi:type 1 fimbria pilin